MVKCLVKNILWWLADYVLSKTPGNTVSNMSSSRALRDVTNKTMEAMKPVP
jgi:hypothetical protein